MRKITIIDGDIKKGNLPDTKLFHPNMLIKVGAPVHVKIWDSIKLYNPNHPDSQNPYSTENGLILSVGDDALAILTVKNNSTGAEQIVISKRQIEIGLVELYILE